CDRTTVNHRWDGPWTHPTCASLARPVWVWPYRLPGALHREESPLSGDAVEAVHPTIDEAQARARHQILHGAGNEDLGGCGGRHYPGSDVHGDPPHVVPHQLTLARVEPGPDLDPQGADPIADGAGATDCPRGAVEGRKEAVPHRPDFSTPMPFEFPSDNRMVRVEECAPRTVAQRRGPVRRAHDVGEEDGGEHAVELPGGTDAGQELPELVDDRVLL